MASLELGPPAPNSVSDSTAGSGESGLSLRAETRAPFTKGAVTPHSSF